MSEIRKHGQLGGWTSGPRTLSGHVYVDESNNTWYQMGPGGSIFHWGSEVEIMEIEAFNTHFFRRQTGIPIFKLICPDGTKGSKETIVVNPMINIKEEVDAMGNVREVAKGASKLGEVGQTVHVRRLDLHVTTMEHQGSYNFAETAVIGRDWHTKFDVETHQKEKIYIDPRDRFTPLKDRIFTEALLRSAGANTKSTVRNMRDIRLDSTNRAASLAARMEPSLPAWLRRGFRLQYQLGLLSPILPVQCNADRLPRTRCAQLPGPLGSSSSRPSASLQPSATGYES